MHYTYVLESIRRPPRYIGSTSNLNMRLTRHNDGTTRWTADHRPWKLKLYIAFESRSQALHFERCLKSGSGHAFASRHF